MFLLSLDCFLNLERKKKGIFDIVLNLERKIRGKVKICLYFNNFVFGKVFNYVFEFLYIGLLYILFDVDEFLYIKVISFFYRLRILRLG